MQLENINGGVEIWANLERTWHEFTFLRISFQYKVTVFAVNAFGQGEKATLVFRLVDTPQPPQAFDVIKTTYDSVELGWTKPVNIGSDQKSNFNLYLSMSENSQFSTLLASNIEQERFEVKGLIIGQVYFFELATQNSFSESMERAKLTVLFRTMPKPPSELLVVEKSGSEAFLAWNPIETFEDRGGFDLVNFMLSIQ